LLAQIVVATAVPVAIAVLKTTNFFHDDPNSVASLKRRHAEEIANLKKTQAQKEANLEKFYRDAIAEMEKEHAAEVARLKAENATLKAELAKMKTDREESTRPRPLRDFTVQENKQEKS
jgi:hypothetical protein